jgi:hypothetical protein
MLDRDSDNPMSGDAAEPAQSSTADGPLQLTYRELGERLGLSADGARAMARRRGWPVVHDEVGRSLVEVAADALAQQLERRTAQERVGDDEAARAHTKSMAARVAEMVAAIKAEPPVRTHPDQAADRAERERLIGLMSQFLAMYERERVGWFSAVSELSAKLDDGRNEANALIAAQEQERRHWEATLEEIEAGLSAAREASRAAESQHEQAVVQHRRALADLTVMHNDQRSLWLLERRRLETTIEALENAKLKRRRPLRIHKSNLLRGLAAALIAVLAGMALARDSGPIRGHGLRQEPDRSEHRAQLVLRAIPAGAPTVSTDASMQRSPVR